MHRPFKIWFDSEDFSYYFYFFIVYAELSVDNGAFHENEIDQN